MPLPHEVQLLHHETSACFATIRIAVSSRPTNAFWLFQDIIFAWGFIQFFSLPVGCCTQSVLFRVPPHLFFPQLNLHSTRVRRKASGFLHVAVSKARNPTVLVSASC
jgi:hypothetical protein